MTVKQALTRVLERLEEGTFDTFGETSRRVAEGVRDSGVPTALESLRAQQHDDLFSIAVAVGIGASNIVEAVAQNRFVLESIESALRNPLATAADEYYRRGIQALRQGWLPEAVGDLGKSISQNPYAPTAHAALAVAYSNSGEAALAADQSLLALRYAGGEGPGVIAGCALLAIALLESDGRLDEARSVCARAYSSVPNCAELALAQARLVGDPDALEQAIRLAPGLAAIALAARLKDADAVIDRVLRDPMGPFLQARTAAESFRVVLVSAHPKAGAEPTRENLAQPTDLTAASVVLDQLGALSSRGRELAQRSAALLIAQRQQSASASNDREARDVQARRVQQEIDALRASRLRWRMLGYGLLLGAALCFVSGLASAGSGGPVGSWSAQSTWLVVFTIAGIWIGGWSLTRAPKLDQEQKLGSQLRQIKMQRIVTTDTSYTDDQLETLAAALSTLDRVASLAPTRIRPYAVGAASGS